MSSRILILFTALMLGLSGSAFAAGDISVSNADFGSVYIPDDPPVSQNVKITGGGGQPKIVIDSVGSALGGNNPGDFSIDLADDCIGANVPGPCNVEMTFTPTGFFTRSAIVTITATNADNTNPPLSGTFTFEVTGTGEGCGDGILNGPEACDFVDPNSVGCCDNACAAANDSAACTAGGCKTDGACNGGFCDGGTDAPDGTACGANNQCITGATCNNGSCEGGEQVVCPPAPECQVQEGCDPAVGCVLGNSPAGTPCGAGQTCDGNGNCGSPLSISKSPNNSQVACSQNIVYTITVTNNGAEDATNVVVTDSVPVGIDFVSVTASQGTCNDTLPPTCNVGTLGTGESATIEVTVQAVSQVTVVNTATADSDQDNPVSDNASVAIVGGDCPGGCSLSLGAASSTYGWGIFVILLGFGSWIRSRIHRQ